MQFHAVGGKNVALCLTVESSRVNRIESSCDNRVPSTLRVKAPRCSSIVHLFPSSGPGWMTRWYVTIMAGNSTCTVSSRGGSCALYDIVYNDATSRQTERERSLGFSIIEAWSYGRWSTRTISTKLHPRLGASPPYLSIYLSSRHTTDTVDHESVLADIFHSRDCYKGISSPPSVLNHHHLLPHWNIGKVQTLEKEFHVSSIRWIIPSRTWVSREGEGEGGNNDR